MQGWKWLTQPQQPYTWGFVVRVLLKAALLFALLNVLYAALTPLDAIGRISIYNWLVAGRVRLPYGEDPARAYNLSVDNIPTMFATHVISQPKARDEFRVVLLGDSSTWGFLLPPDQTLSAFLNAQGLQLDDGRRLVFYNLGHPIMALMKDALLLEYAMQYEPDMIVWLVTAQSFPRSRQLEAPIVARNPARAAAFIERYGLAYDTATLEAETDFMAQTIIGQRRPLADWLRLQLYGFMWGATGIDQYIPESYTLRQSDFEADAVAWGEDFPQPQTLTVDDLAFDVLAAGHQIAGDVPLLLVNEPMFISDGENSDVRYNFFYPRWAYDQYRELMTAQAEENGWHYVDLWRIIAPEEFTDSPVHMTPEGTAQLAEALAPHIMALVQGDSKQ